MAIFTEPNITAPTEPFSYQGKQVIVNGDRLLFNAKNDDILLYSNTYLGFSTNGSIHFDTGDTEKDCFFVVNSPDIFLGLNGPVVKSHGGTDPIGFYYSIDLCYKIIKGNLMGQIKSNLNHLDVKE